MHAGQNVGGGLLNGANRIERRGPSSSHSIRPWIRARSRPRVTGGCLGHSGNGCRSSGLRTSMLPRRRSGKPGRSISGRRLPGSCGGRARYEGAWAPGARTARHAMCTWEAAGRWMARRPERWPGRERQKLLTNLPADVSISTIL